MDRRHVHGVLVLMVMAGGACKDDAPSAPEFCSEMNRLLCHKLDECDPDEGIDCSESGDFPSLLRCDPDDRWECDEARENARECLDDLEEVPCNEFPLAIMHEERSPASCQAMACPQPAGTEGGPCYGNGTCDDGLVCASHRCEFGPATGTEGGACYGNDTCNLGLDCLQGVCVVGTEATFGGCGSAVLVADPLALPSLAGHAYRFDLLALSKPLPDNLVGLVNPVIADQIAAEQINLLLVIDADDRGAGTLSARLGTASRREQGVAGFRFDAQPESIEYTLVHGRIDSTRDASLSIAIAMGEEPMVLPVQALRLAGALSADASEVPVGRLTGAITVEDAANVNVPLYGTLKALLEQQDPPVQPDTQVGGKDAWTLEACFTATTVTLQ